MRNRFLGRSGVALVVLGVVAGCGGGDAGDAEPAPATPEPSPPPAAAAPASGDLVAQGLEVFNGAGLCMTCHGNGGTGTALAPSLVDDTWLWIDSSQPLEPQISTIVHEGVPEPKEHPAPMPVMGGGSLSEAQITAVAAYVASL